MTNADQQAGFFRRTMRQPGFRRDLAAGVGAIVLNRLCCWGSVGFLLAGPSVELFGGLALLGVLMLPLVFLLVFIPYRLLENHALRLSWAVSAAAILVADWAGLFGPQLLPLDGSGIADNFLLVQAIGMVFFLLVGGLLSAGLCRLANRLARTG